MPCDWCNGHEWLLDECEEGVGFTYKPCPKCLWSHRPLPPIPAPVDALAFLSDNKRIELGEEAAWRQYAKEEQTWNAH